MSEKERMAEAATEVAAATPEPEKPKKTVQRRPVWVCVPVEFEDIPVTDGNGASFTIRKPTRYVVAKCPGGKGQVDAIRAVLTEHQIDPTNFEHVLMFRAEPLTFAIENQLIVRFGEEIL